MDPYFDTFNPKQRFFYDSKTLIKSDFPRVCTLNNLDTGESYKSLQEADCKNKKVRFLSMYLYPLPFGEGKSTFFKTSPTEWTYPVPDTASDAILEILCTKSK